MELSANNQTRVITYSFEELLDLKDKHPKAKIIAGNTEIGIEQRFLNAQFDFLISPLDIKELKFIKHNKEFLEIGSLTTLTEILVYLKEIYENEISKQKNNMETNIQRGIRPIIRQLYYFSGTSIRFFF
jgi:xanthine dehydrogenase/oxidase